MFAVLKLQGNIYTIFNTALYKLPGIGGTCVGLRLGWLNIIIPATVGIIFYIMLLAVTFLCSEHSFSLKNTDIVFFILTFFTGTILIFTSEYVGWTALRAEIIEGVQGRYFIPILPCLMLPFAYKNHFVKTFFKNKNFGRIKLAYLIIIAFTLNFIALVRVYKFYPDISKTEKVTASLSSDKSSIDNFVAAVLRL